MLESRLMSRTICKALPVLIAFLLVNAVPMQAQREPAVPKELLERVSDWAERLLAMPLSYSAQETLQQTHFGSKSKSGGGQRQIVSQYFSVRFPSNLRERVEFRDLISVDGKMLQSAEKRAVKWQKISAAQSPSDMSSLIEDPLKYRLSPERFTGLARLAGRFAERNWEKMKYFFGQDTSDPPSKEVLIAYRQMAGEGLMVVDDKAVYPSGQAWVEPDDGHIARIVEEFQVKDSRYYTEIEFGKSDTLDAWVPQNVIVRSFEKGRLILQNVYSYAAFQKITFEQTAGNNSSPR